MSAKIEMVGKTYGNVNVLYEKEERSSAGIMYVCKCLLCGRIFTTCGKGLRKGSTKSCGCVNRKSLIDRNTIHGLSVDYPRTHQTIRCHFYLIKKGIGNYKFWTLDPRYTNDTDGIAKFCRDFVKLHPEECRRYEDDKTLVLDKDNDPDHVFRPESLRVVTALENKNNTCNTKRLDDGTPLAVFCHRAGVETRINGEKTKRYRKYYDYSRNHNGEGHPELLKKANDLIALYSKCLKLLKLRDEVRQFAEKIAH